MGFSVVQKGGTVSTKLSCSGVSKINSLAIFRRWRRFEVRWLLAMTKLLSSTCIGGCGYIKLELPYFMTYEFLAPTQRMNLSAA